MNKNSLLGFGFLTVFAVLLWLIIPQMWGAYSSLPVGLSSPLTAVAGGLLVAIYTKMMDRNSETKARQREKQVDLYERLIRRSTSTNLIEGNAGQTGDSKIALLQDMLLWASDDVLKHYGNHRELLRNPSSHADEGAGKELAKTILAVRKDLDHKNRKVKVDDVCSLLQHETEGQDGSLSNFQGKELTNSDPAQLPIHQNADVNLKRSA